jgi:hypothetical protein
VVRSNDCLFIIWVEQNSKKCIGVKERSCCHSYRGFKRPSVRFVIVSLRIVYTSFHSLYVMTLGRKTQ